MSSKKKYGVDALNSFAARIQEAQQLEEQARKEEPAAPETQPTQTTPASQPVQVENKPAVSSPVQKTALKTIVEVPKKNSPKTIAKPADRGNEPRSAKYVQYGMQISTENVEFIKKIKYLEGASFVGIVNEIFDVERKKKEPALDAAIAEIESRRKAWRK